MTSRTKMNKFEFIKLKCIECGETVEILTDYYVNLQLKKCLSCYTMSDNEWKNPKINIK
jgi:hypothetical protein